MLFGELLRPQKIEQLSMQLAGRTTSRILVSMRLDQERTMMTPPSLELSFVEATM